MLAPAHCPPLTTPHTLHTAWVMCSPVTDSPAAADPRAIPVGALVEPDGQPLPTVPTVPTPANDDEGQP